MWRDRRLCDLLGVTHPIIQAPMAGSDTAALAAAVANAGGLGSRGCAMMSPEQFGAAYGETRAATNGALNMNFFAHRAPGDDEQKAARARALLAPFFMELGLGEVPEVSETQFPSARRSSRRCWRRGPRSSVSISACPRRASSRR